MFLQLVADLGGGVIGANQALTTYRPSQLSEYLEACWGLPRDALRQLALGVGAALPHQQMARPAIRLLDALGPVPADPPLPGVPVTWPHFAYAYMLENTRMLEIFQRVVQEWLHGERLPNPTQPTQRWLHATEQLFHTAGWQYSVRSVTSGLRPDSTAVRRNGYYRLLGMDLNHGTDDGRPYPYVKSDTANRDFATLWEALLVEVWRGFANNANLIGPNETDNDAIDTLVRRLQEMLMARRFQGMLSREEYDAVGCLSWFHTALQFNTQIVNDLSAQAAGLADRLRKIGALVGIQPHARSDSYFQLAQPMSDVLIAIESGFVGLLGAASLYGPAGPFTPQMLQIITHWSIATGRNIKDPTLRQPIGAVLTRPVAGPGVSGTNSSRIGAYLG